MALGIQKTLEVIADIGEIAVVGVTVAKTFRGGSSDISAIFRNIDKIITLAAAARELIADLPAALPEMREIDATEAGRLGAAAYAMVTRVIAAAA